MAKGRVSCSSTASKAWFGGARVAPRLLTMAARGWSQQDGLGRACAPQGFRIASFLLNPFETTNPQPDPHLRSHPDLHVPRGSRLLSPRCQRSLLQPGGWDACHFLWRVYRSEAFFPPIQADNWASASAACCSASAFQQTAGASGATLGSATVIPAPPSRNIVPSAQECFCLPFAVVNSFIY